MPTKPRPYVDVPRPAAGYDVCACCGAYFVVKKTGRPRVYCSDNCRSIAYMIEHLESRIDALNPDAPVEGRRILRRTLWRLANLLNSRK